jgi:hypothetical protein
MLDIVPKNQNGNGSDTINGRGVLRRKMTSRERVSLAADVALGVTQLAPSIKQTAAAVGVPTAKIRAELKARTKTRLIDSRRWKQSYEAWEQQRAVALVHAWYFASDEDRAEALRAIGTADVWDVLARVVG